MSEVLIRAQIKSILSGVTGISNVYDYQRWTDKWDIFRDLFKDMNDKIHGWDISRRSTFEVLISPSEYQRVYEYLLRGFYGLKDEDATEITFQALIEAICDEFRSNYNLNATCETTSPDMGPMAGRSGIQVNLVEVRKFGPVLGHYCELGLGAQTIEEV